MVCSLAIGCVTTLSSGCSSYGDEAPPVREVVPGDAGSAPDAASAPDAMSAPVADAGRIDCPQGASLCDDFTSEVSPIHLRWDREGEVAPIGGSLSYSTEVFRSPPRSLVADLVPEATAYYVTARKRVPVATDAPLVVRVSFRADTSLGKKATAAVRLLTLQFEPTNLRGVYVDLLQTGVRATYRVEPPQGPPTDVSVELGKLPLGVWEELAIEVTKDGVVARLGANPAGALVTELQGTHVRVAFGPSAAFDITEPFRLFIDDVVIR